MIFRKLNKFIKQSVIYGFGTVTERGVGVILIPVYIKYLSPAEFGAFTLIEVTIAIISGICSFGIPQTILRFYSSNNNSREEIIGTGISTVLFFGIIFSIIFIILSEYLSEYLLRDSRYTKAFMIAFFSLPFGSFTASIINIWRSQQKAHLFTAFNVFKSLMICILSIIFVVVLSYSVKGLLIAKLVPGVITTIAGLYIFHKEILKFKFTIFKEMMSYGIPLIPSKILMRINNSADRYLVQLLVGIEAVGIYAMAFRIGNIVNRLCTPLLQAHRPYVFNLFDENELNYAKKNTIKSGTIYTIYIVLVSIFIIALGPKFINYFDKNNLYNNSILLIPVILVGVMFIEFFTVTSVGIFIKNKTKYILYLTLFASIINIVLNIILLPRIGVAGAAWSTLISNLFLLIFGYIVSNNLIKLDYRIAVYTFIAGLIIILIYTKLIII